ncbi:MAG TPA: allophanate hydrolase, partial [Rugosimonospora sp.]
MNRPTPSPAVRASRTAHEAAAGRGAPATAAGRGAQPIWTQLLSTSDVLGFAGRAPEDGPLAGMPFALKDNLDLAGYPTTAACPDLAAGPPAAHSAGAVQRLLDAGAVPVGKTNLDQFATGLVGTRSPYGACHSVASAAHVSGGSSSGSALAVATGLVPLALGTDTAGSGRVPAAFNGIVGVKPSRGLVSTRGLLPACRSLDCVTTFTRTVAQARAALSVLVHADPADPWSRPRPPAHPPGVAAHLRVIAVPDGPLDLEPLQDKAWQVVLDRAREVAAYVVPVDITPFLAAARLLYEGPWVAERYAAFGHLLDGPGVDEHVRAVVAPGRDLRAPDAFAAMDRLAALRRATEAVWAGADALLLPVTGEHPTLAQVAADPLGVNGRLGRYTNFVNLLDLCAVAVPAGHREDGLPFGVQLIAPAFADGPLLDLAARWCGEPVPDTPPDPGRTLIAVCGAHLSGLPLSGDLVRLGGTLHHRARTAPGYRLFRLTATGVPRPGLAWTGDGPVRGIAVEVWALPSAAVGPLLDGIPAPLGLGRIALDDGSSVAGFTLGDTLGLTIDGGRAPGEDISGYGGW